MKTKLTALPGSNENRMKTNECYSFSMNDKNDTITCISNKNVATSPANFGSEKNVVIIND